MIQWVVRWLTAGFCAHYAAFLILTGPRNEMQASNMDIDLEDGFYG